MEILKESIRRLELFKEIQAVIIKSGYLNQIGEIEELTDLIVEKLFAMERKKRTGG